MFYEIAFFYIIAFAIFITGIFNLVAFFFGKSLFGIYIQISTLQSFALILWLNFDYPNNLKEMLI